MKNPEHNFKVFDENENFITYRLLRTEYDPLPGRLLLCENRLQSDIRQYMAAGAEENLDGRLLTFPRYNDDAPFSERIYMAVVNDTTT